MGKAEQSAIKPSQAKATRAEPSKTQLNQAEQNTGPFPTKLRKVGWGVAR